MRRKNACRRYKVRRRTGIGCFYGGEEWRVFDVVKKVRVVAL